MHSTRGSLSEISFIEVLRNAAAANLTGMIRLENGPTIKVVYFQNGTIAFASSNEKSDRLTEVLKRAGKLTPEQVEDAQSRLKPNISLGKTLVELGYITARDLLWGARAQVEGILYQILFWNEGTFQILEGSLPKEIIILNLSVPGVIFEGICKSKNRDWVLSRIESPEAVYRLTSDFHEKYVPHKLRMMRADDVVSRMDGKRSIEKISQLAGIDTFEACKITAALELLELIEKAPEAAAAPEPEPAVEVVEELEEQEQLEEIQMSAGAEIASVGRANAEQLMLDAMPVSVTVSNTSEEPFHIEEREQISTNRLVASDQEQELPFLEPGLEPIALPEPEPAMESEFLSEAAPKPTTHRGGLWILIVLAILALGASGYYYYSMRPPVIAHNPPPPVHRPTALKPVAKPQVPTAKAPSSPALELQSPPVPVPEPQVPAAKAPSSPALEPQSPPVPVPQPQVPTAKPRSSPALEPQSPPVPVPEPPKVAAIPPASSDATNLLQAGNYIQAAAQFKDVLSAEKSKYAVQLAIACQSSTVSDAAKTFRAEMRFYILPMQYKGQSCYRLMFGNFDSPEDASEARSSLPSAFLRQPSPPQIVPVRQLLSR